MTIYISFFAKMHAGQLTNPLSSSYHILPGMKSSHRCRRTSKNCYLSTMARVQACIKLDKEVNIGNTRNTNRAQVIFFRVITNDGSIIVPFHSIA